MGYSITDINDIVGGRLVSGGADGTIEHLLLDSRRLIFPATSLFFALKGPRRTGDQFAKELYKRGVRNFVLEQETVLPGANQVIVKDTLAALQRLVAEHRRRFPIPVIGITGSNGKTIIKEWLNQLLEADYHIVRSPKSYNSQTGVPLSVWQMGPRHQLAIFEAGISRRGEMERLEPVIRPTIGVFTNIGEAHSEGFGSLEEKAAEKLRLFGHAEILVYCSDQPETEKAVRSWAKQIGGGPHTWSWGHHIDDLVRIESMHKLDGWTTIAVANQGREITFSIPFTDEASIENAMHCLTVMIYLNIPDERIIARLARLAPIAMRLELKSGINHCSIINDSYSADLNSLSIALDFLSQQQQHDKHTVILSDFLESGREENQLYETIAQTLGQKQVDRLIGIGPRIGAHASAFSQWFPGETVFFPTVEAFRADWARLHFRDETILIKGARVFEFEEIDRLLTEQIHQTVMEVDLNAMAQNLRQFRQLLQPGTRVMAMVKAFGYGSGSFEIANLLQFHGIDWLGVAYADEGVVLRKGGIRVPIMVMNTENSSFDWLVEYNLQPVIYSFPLLHTFDRWLKKEGVPAFPVHIELETGMNRLGFPGQDIGELLRVLPGTAFTVVSVFSHFAASEEAQQDAFTRQQAELYTTTADRIAKTLGYPFLRHIANSAGIIRHPDLQMDMVRLGIGLYGIDPAPSGQVELQEVSTLKTTIAQIKHLHPGDTIGYGRKGIAAAGTVTATVRIGYADGYARSLGNGVGKMWVKGRLAPTIGIVAMDMTMIDITGIPDVKEGDEVIVFGKELSVSQLAAWSNTIPYEILTSVSQRVKRIYFEE
ncbi:MAG TPA: bifunctional UDP-N-acetylmuramoyl-tripeptide:D-alanyl-D-alanine ligase/alanine racemase [Puia sp.]|uniref:bifunctional UDP-N-acetylmuramoyl-tripeptide:D-alanyl-D-alanine ligase/alanine racemase n=1 Tax=Puia sp. TaxID=2045100 RepID=UPI002C3F86D4|nr:bifunctional UDP-N-acetylmuramoyl-tripeptide:D-alanyl-D-alanine ligase/alanine racemase [Puia sp.]HVU97637.1 bifunctional UDP-N-acetylmuramoyl-tripeptide:D-alanyl-D-alanine ligase/alanine racemase [Puia sp.]